MHFIFNLGTRYGLPKYILFIAILQIIMMSIPESDMARIGISAEHFTNYFSGHIPDYFTYYIGSSSFQNGMLAFLLTSPITLGVSTFLFLSHINGIGYDAYIERRNLRIMNNKNKDDYSLIIGSCAAIALYIWGTFFCHSEPLIWGEFIPQKNKIALLLIHAGSLIFILPLSITMLFTEIRANLSNHLANQ